MTDVYLDTKTCQPTGLLIRRERGASTAAEIRAELPLRTMSSFFVLWLLSVKVILCVCYIASMMLKVTCAANSSTSTIPRE